MSERTGRALGIVLNVVLALSLLLLFSIPLHTEAHEGWIAHRTAEALPASVTVRVDPSASIVMVGDAFTIGIIIDGALNLGSFEFELAYDPAILQAMDVTLGPFLGSTGRSIGVVGPTIDNVGGRVTFGAFSFGSQPGPSGTGTLAAIAFSAAGVGTSLLDLQNTQVTDTLGNPQTPVTEEDGMVSVIAGMSYRVYLPSLMRQGTW